MKLQRYIKLKAPKQISQMRFKKIWKISGRVL